MGVKVAVVGGGSTYTPELVEGFVTRVDRLPVDELVLLDIDRERLDVVGAPRRTHVRKVGWAGALSSPTTAIEAIDGADFVIVQLRVGGNQARDCATRRSRSPSAASARRRPALAGSRRRFAPCPWCWSSPSSRVGGAPGAWFVDFTNPTGLVTQALLDRGHRAIGLCNVAIGFQREMADARSPSSPDRVQLDHVGLNHLTWERAVLVDGEDRLPELLTPAPGPSTR